MQSPPTGFHLLLLATSFLPSFFLPFLQELLCPTFPFLFFLYCGFQGVGDNSLNEGPSSLGQWPGVLTWEWRLL